MVLQQSCFKTYFILGANDTLLNIVWTLTMKHRMKEYVPLIFNIGMSYFDIEIEIMVGMLLIVT